MSTSSLIRPVRLSPLDLLSLGLIGIRTRKMRAALSALGICIGVATMVVVTGVPASSQASLLNQLSSLGTGMLQATPMPDQQPPIRLPNEAEAMVARINPVIAVTAVANTHRTVRRNISTEPSPGTTVLASRLNLVDVIDAQMYSGRFLNTVTARLPTTVLGAEAASRLGITTVDATTASQVIVDGRKFAVVGVLRPVALSPEIDRSILIGWEVAQTVLGFDGHPTTLYVHARDFAVEAVRAVLPATIYPEAPGLVRITKPSDALAAKRATENTYSALFLGLAAVSLLVGAIGVANTMVISVLERRHEIGLRRALGANKGHIRVQFLVEAVALSLLGGTTGTALGVTSTAVYAAHQGWPAVIPLNTLAAAVAATAVVGIIAGAYPAIRAARLSPTVALAA